MRVEERNRESAQKYNALSLADYYANIKAFVQTKQDNYLLMLLKFKIGPF